MPLLSELYIFLQKDVWNQLKHTLNRYFFAMASYKFSSNLKA